MGWLIAAGILAVLAFLPLGVGGVYDHTGYRLYFRIGPVKFTLLPRKHKKKKAKKSEVPAQNDTKNAAVSENKNNATGGGLKEFLPLARSILDFLCDVHLKLRVNRLEAKLTLADDDPADLAIAYGRAWAIVGNVLTQLERLFVIKKRDVEVLCDFTADKTRIFVRLDASITLASLLWCSKSVIREFLKIMNQRKGGAKI